MPAGVLELANGAAPSTPSNGLTALFANATKQLGTIDDAGLKLLHPIIRQDETVAVKPQLVNGNSAAPVGNVSTAAKMMGLAFAFTPQVTGRVAIFIAGMAINVTAIGSGTSVSGKYGTGAAPVNGGASAGTLFGLLQPFVAATVAQQAGFVCMGVVSGLTLNVPIWIDLELLAVVSGGASVKGVQCIAFEL